MTLQQAMRGLLETVVSRETLKLLISAKKALKVEVVNRANALHPDVQ